MENEMISEPVLHNGNASDAHERVQLRPNLSPEKIQQLMSVLSKADIQNGNGANYPRENAFDQNSDTWSWTALLQQMKKFNSFWNTWEEEF